mgnify:CR=1 FL=1|tara:strand:- start:92364 stop:98750 length:6387 start_codon:yes stop_codon:yes gene_type:complete
MSKNNKGNMVDVRLSNKTDNETHVNSKDGANLQSGKNEASGADLNISGVSSGARVSSDIGADHINVSLDSAWNSIKNIEVSSKQAKDVNLDNFVHTDVNLRGNGDSNVNVTGAKRGNIRTGNGDDNISVDAQTNNAGWTNNFNIYSGKGDDVLTLNGDKGITTFNVRTGYGNDEITMVGDDYSAVRAHLGMGDDHFTGGSGADKVHGGHGNDIIRTGSGNDILHAGIGDDILDGGAGVDIIRAGKGDDTIVFDGDDKIIDGGKGDDTLVVDGHLDVSAEKIKSIERIEMRDDAGDDSVDIDMTDARKMSETDIVKLTGDAGDSVNAFEYEAQLDDVTDNGVTYSVFEGSKGEQIWVQHGMSMGDEVVGAPDVPEEPVEIGESVLLGTKSESGSMLDWGTLNENGSVSFDKNGITGTVEAFNKHGDDADVSYTVGGSGGGRNDFGIGVNGGGSSEIDLNESIAVSFDSSMSSARVGFDSLFGNFNDGSKPNARVEWKAYENGEVVASGEIKNDAANSDGDGQRETNFIDVEHSFDRLEFGTVSPTSNINSNFIIRYIDAVAAPVAPVPEEPLDMVFLSESASYKSTLGYYVVDEEGNITDVHVNFENASLKGSGGDLIGGESSSAIDVPDGSHVEFFIVANGYTSNKAYENIDLNEGELKFVNEQGEPANIHDAEVPELTFTSAEGETITLKGNVYHTNNENLNVDGLDHAHIEVSEDGQSLVVGFEDLKGLGDADFNDSVFQVNVGERDVTVGGVDFGDNTDVPVDPVNEVPVANDDAFATDEDVALNFTVSDLLVNDSDVDGGVLAVTSIDAVSANGAAVTYNSNTGEISYTPVAEFNGEDTLTYTISDGQGGETTATITVTVNPVYDAPVASDVHATAVEDGAAVVLDGSVVNADGGQLFYTLASAPDEGTVINNGDGTFTFDVGTAFQDLDSGETRDIKFSYQVTDMQGNFSVAEATVTVAGINDTPDARDVNYVANEDTVTEVTRNFNVSDVDGEAVTITLLNQLDPQTEGVVVNNGDGTFTFTPALDAFAYLNEGEEVTFTVDYLASDGDASDTASLSFTVTGVNDPTVVEEIVIDDVVDDGEPIIIDLGAVVHDPDGNDTVTISVPNPPNPETEGTLVDNGDDTFTFEPAPALDELDDGETQEIVFEYEVVDEAGNVVTETVTIIVAGTNDAPVAEDIHISTTEDNSVSSVLIATDVDANDTLSYSVVDAPNPLTEGTVSVLPNGQFSFTPAEALNALAVGESVEVTFTYKASDGDAEDIAEVTVTVTGANDKPVIDDISITHQEDQAAQTIDISAFISDPDSDDDASTLTYSVATVSKGSLTDLGNGVLEFDPQGDFEYLGVGDTANVNVVLQVTDSHGATTAQNIVIRVTGENDAPVAELAAVTLSEDGSASLLMPVSDVDGDSLSVSFVNPPSTDVLSFDISGKLVAITPGAGLQYLDDGETVDINVTYNVTDGAEIVQNVLTVTVIGSNDAPVIENVTHTILEDAGSITGTLTGVDYEGDDIIYLVNTPPVDSDGFVTFDNVNDTFTFTLNDNLDSMQAGETKVISFTYVATDGKDTSAPQTIQITVEGQNDAPVITSVSEVVGEDSGTSIFSLGVTDVDNSMAELSFVLDDAPENATVILNQDGTFSFTPGSDLQSLNDGETALVEFTYTVSDGISSVTQTATITVLGSNDEPVVNQVFFDAPFQSIERYEFGFDVNEAFSGLSSDAVITFTDNSGNPAPTWVQYNAAEMKVEAKAPANNYGEYNLIMHVNDGASIITQDFTLFVNRPLESLDVTSIINGSNDNVITGTDASEFISVNDGNDIVNAGAGNDTIYGGSGDDILNGGDGNDTFLLTGLSDGNDTINGGDGYDKIVFHESGNKTYELNGDYSLASQSIEEFVSSGGRVTMTNGTEDDVIDLTGITFDGNFRIYGGNGNDVMMGSAEGDYLNGGGDNDTMYGAEGDDQIYGSTGDDLIFGGAGDDYIDAGPGADNVYGGEGDDIIRYNADDVIVDGGVGGFDIISHRSTGDIDFTSLATDYSNIEAIDLDFSNRATEIVLGLDDVIDMKDTSIDTLYILGDTGDNVVTDGDFSIATRIDVVDTNGDGVTDTTFQVFASGLQSDIYIGLEIGVGMSIDGTIV